MRETAHLINYKGDIMNWIHVIDIVFFVVLPIGVIAYAIKYAWEDING
tara:strand:- start:438 stop:581 length:144 start_codon:yes stop_codon:yes gene_type:complete